MGSQLQFDTLYAARECKIAMLWAPEGLEIQFRKLHFQINCAFKSVALIYSQALSTFDVHQVSGFLSCLVTHSLDVTSQIFNSGICLTSLLIVLIFFHHPASISLAIQECKATDEHVNDSTLPTHKAVIWCYFSKLTSSHSSVHNFAILLSFAAYRVSN